MNDFVKSVLYGNRTEPKMGVELEKSGAVRIDVEGFLASVEGQNELKRVQELWERVHPDKTEV